MKLINLACIAILAINSLYAQINPQVLKDINTTSNSNPSLFESIGNTTYFVAQNKANGAELWKVNENTNNVSLVKDINPGPSSTYINSIENFNGILLIGLFNYTSNSSELWQSDGTSLGTVLIKGNIGFSGINNITYVGGKVYFGVAGDLWITDGTAIGTYLLKQMNSSTSPSKFTNVNGTVFFIADNGIDGVELWKTDGTSAGTAIVKNIHPAGSAFSGITNLVNVGGTLYFNADDGVNGAELWKSDGTAAGTIMVRDINTGAVTSAIIGMTAFNNQLFFMANDGSNVQKLWKSDGTLAGTTLVKNIWFDNILLGFFNIDTKMEVVSGKLYCSATDGVSGVELWQSDGTTAGTVLVKDINPGAAGSSVAGLIKMGGTLYFSANDGVNGFELWRSNGTTTGTVVVKHIAPYGYYSPSLYPLGSSKIVFAADDGVMGNELWISDGTATGTVGRDIYLGSEGQEHFNFGKGLLGFNNKVLFGANKGGTAFSGQDELWITDGTLGGTMVVDTMYSFPSYFFNLNGKILFFNQGSLWKTDGTNTGTVQIPGLYNVASDFAKIGNEVYFSASDASYTNQLWKTDGTTGNTTRITNNLYYAQKLYAVGNTLFFEAYHNNGRELWVSDGTSFGTNLLKDINSGAPSSNITMLNHINSTMYFKATDGTNGEELWKSDGTSFGTVMIRDIAPGSASSNIDETVTLNGTLFFTATGNAGKELWKSNGTYPGTILVKDINTAAATGSDPKHLTIFDNKVYFQATEPTKGTELYVSDGTNAGTNIFMEFDTIGSSGTSNLIVGGSKLYFSANDGAGTALYETDGTVANTQKLFLFAAAGFTTIYEQYFYNGKLYFTADHEHYGLELMVYDPALPFNGFISVDKIEDQTPLAILYPNPNDGQFILKMEGDKELDLRIYSTAGVKVLEEHIFNMDTYQVQMKDLPSGVYFVQLSTKAKQQTIRFVKQ